MKKALRILVILLLLWLGFLFVIKNPQLWVSQTVLKTLGLERLLSWQTVGLANPASVYCEQNSGTLEIVTDLSGWQSWLCHLPDGNVCDERAYFRGECPTTGIDLSGCISYFDGCNNCSVKDGKPDACTMMYCETPAEPECLQYATGVEVTGSTETTSDILSKMITWRNILQNLWNTTDAWVYTINVIEWTAKDQLEIINQGDLWPNWMRKTYVDLPYDKTCNGGDTWPCGKFGWFRYTDDIYVFFNYTTHNEDTYLVALDLGSKNISQIFQITDDTIFDTTQNGDQFFIGNSQSFDPDFRITYKNDISKYKSIWVFKVYGYYSNENYLYLQTDDWGYQSTKRFLRKIDLNTLIEVETINL